MDKIESDIYDIIADVFEIKRTEITPTMGWENQNVDSFALVELVVGIQEHFGVQLDTPELEKLKTVEDMVNIVREKLGKNT